MKITGALRGHHTSFKKMFNSHLGEIILLRNDKLALNVYACAGVESSHYSGACGDKGKSFGYFQMHTKVHTPKYIKMYIDRAVKEFNISNFWKQKLYTNEEWEFSVGKNIEYPYGNNLNVSVQLACWLGYMFFERYFERLSNVNVARDIKRYQAAQRFHKSLMNKYQKRLRDYIEAYQLVRNKSFEETLQKLKNKYDLYIV